ncbi:GIY-YIG nuclease family protein [Kangiella shandongensis]|uniref:GIY-YIG nuclease family protein n=1 Tax=Kangiella shandongensis TaxID=2763258 RepID=UPI001CBEDCF6|nr:GIY-YIG nuclease family protein [Kangiella shandongensis]
MKQYCVYIMASKKNGFTKKYYVRRLVYFDVGNDIKECLEREKQLKAWKRQWKIKLIESRNPHWKDLWNEVARSITK